MARQIRAPKLENRTSRLRLAPRRKPYFALLSPGISLGYRRNSGAGSWSVKASDGHGGAWLKAFGLADDHEDSNGASVLDFWAASTKARELARGDEGNGDRPATVDEALTAYEADLEARGGAAGNVSRVRFNLPNTLAAKVVTLLTAAELRNWRNKLVKAGMAASSADRTARALSAALTLASPVVNAAAWKTGLERLPDSEEARQNMILPDEAVRAICTAAHTVDSAYGLHAELAAVTGARRSQMLRCRVYDLEDAGPAPRVQMPSSRKGRNRKVIRRALPIPVELAKALRAAAAGRPDDAPLLLRGDGSIWPPTRDDVFPQVIAAAGLDAALSPYSLRHSSICRALLAGVPLQLVASSHDTSAAIIAKHYARYITDNSDTVLRRAMLDLSAISLAPNVVTIARAS
jgi:integrase